MASCERRPIRRPGNGQPEPWTDMTPTNAQPDAAPTLARGPLRWLLMLAGFLALGLAALGVVLPVLPTTPFVLVAAACFARSSPRFYNWLLSNRVFGPLILDWSEHRGIPLRAKVISVVMIALVGGASVIWVIDPLWAKLLVVAVLASVSTWLISRPTTPAR